MPYKIYISASASPERNQHIAVIKRALLSINEIPITVADLSAAGEAYTIELAKPFIDQSDIFIGIYGKSYDAADADQSVAEHEYHYAVSRDKTIFVFMPQDLYGAADERQQLLLKHIMERHVVTQFTDDVDLAAKVKLAIANHKAASKTVQLRPSAEMGFNVDRQQPAIITETDNFESLVNRAVTIAQDEIEQIVRRAIELHEAQTQLQKREATTGAYVEDLRDGQVLARPIWGEPLRRSQFQSDIFMIMPFRERFNAIYNNVIRPVTADLNLTIKRGDDFTTTQGAIITEVWAAIYNCKVVIAETTEINANVYYELGMAHMLGKPAILLTQTREVEQLPFDIRHLRFLVYEDSVAGGEELTKDLRQSLVWILNDLKEQETE
jgi:hypothetical protein